MVNEYIDQFKGSGDLVVYLVQNKVFLIESTFLNSHISETKERIQKTFPNCIVRIEYVDPYVIEDLLQWDKEKNVSAYKMLRDIEE